ncbi:MAG: hypothetical protein JWO68_2881 [Actinomycetia bacterium]|nr:hypothetical protein [Actinomycetes bacterium]
MADVTLTRPATAAEAPHAWAGQDERIAELEAEAADLRAALRMIRASSDEALPHGIEQRGRIAPPSVLVDEGQMAMAEAMALAERMESLCGRVRRLEGAISLTSPNDDESVNAWLDACRAGDLYDVLTAIAGKAENHTGCGPFEADGVWTTSTLRQRFGMPDN